MRNKVVSPSGAAGVVTAHVRAYVAAAADAERFAQCLERYVRERDSLAAFLERVGRAAGAMA